MALPQGAMGRWAVERVLEPAPSPDPAQERLRCPLVVRASVAPPRTP